MGKSTTGLWQSNKGTVVIIMLHSNSIISLKRGIKGCCTSESLAPHKVKTRVCEWGGKAFRLSVASATRMNTSLQRFHSCAMLTDTVGNVPEEMQIGHCPAENRK